KEQQIQLNKLNKMQEYTDKGQQGHMKEAQDGSKDTLNEMEGQMQEMQHRNEDQMTEMQEEIQELKSEINERYY
ncbi:MAG: hypothetical protein GY795_34240, partial [Desulfobacterales bacterium]|nr:hypothetical protein [Desulfobacterales bacterium]